MDSTPLLSASTPASRKVSFAQFYTAFWPICFIAFGGPQAHVALMQNKFVDVPPVHTGPRIKRSIFLELFALAQSLPGPGSTQLVCALGATYGGLPGAAITFFTWHITGFIIMTVAGLWFHKNLNDPSSLVFLNNLTDYCVGLIAAAFAFVLVAALSFVKNTSTNDMKVAILLASMFVAITIPPAASSWVFVVLLVAGGFVYYVYDRSFAADSQQHGADADDMDDDWEANVSPLAGAFVIAVVVAITIIVALVPNNSIGNTVLKIFWRIGLLTFGGGIVVIPMLLNEFVESGLLPTSVFLAGFSLFGCVPGPMFNIAPFLGAATAQIPGALYGSLGAFGPGCLLQVGLLPYWERLRKIKVVKTILNGTNAAAVGLIAAGVWQLMKKAFSGPTAFGLTVTAGMLKVKYNTSPVLIILSHGVIGFILVTLGIGGPFHVVQNPIGRSIFPMF